MGLAGWKACGGAATRPGSVRATHTHRGIGPSVRHKPFPHLNEANVRGLLAEALTADVQAILADDGVAVAAHTAANAKSEHTKYWFRSSSAVVSCALKLRCD